MKRYHLTMLLLTLLFAGCSIRTSHYTSDSFSIDKIECTLAKSHREISGPFYHSSPWYIWDRKIVFRRGENVYIKDVDERVQNINYFGGNTLISFFEDDDIKIRQDETEIGYMDISDSNASMVWIGVLPRALDPVDQLSRIFGQHSRARIIFNSTGDKILFQKKGMKGSFFWLSSDQSISPVSWRMPSRLDGHSFAFEGLSPLGEPILKRVKGFPYSKRLHSD